MAEYFAMIKKVNDNTPYKLNYTAEMSYHSAIAGMLEHSNLTDTNQLAEFEIMRITENGNAYTPVASKGPSRKKNNPVVVTSPVSPTSSDEQVYTPTKVVNEGTE